jgi:hypothetical protein
VGPAFDGSEQPGGWFEIHEHRLVKDGTQVGWISGAQIYLKHGQDIMIAELYDPKPLRAPVIGDGSWAGFRLVRRGSEMQIFSTDLFNLGELGQTIDRRQSFEGIQP